MARGDIKVEIVGDLALQTKLLWLRKNSQRRIMRRAVRRGLKPIRAAAKRMVPVRWGTLKRAIQSSVTATAYGRVLISGRVPAGEKGKVPPGGGKVWKLSGGEWAYTKKAKKMGDRLYLGYAFFQEFGTRYIAANPFMRPALQEARAKALSEMRDEVRNQLNALPR